jgi:TPP-dependent pyruvate/acetoin dehydrogenase alpha subunit
MSIDRELALIMFTRMVTIRQFEETAIDLFKRGMVKGAVHPYIGQEASAVGVCLSLRERDLIAGTHRSHGHNLARGADPKRVLAEIKGKETGYCKGRGGSMHVAAFEVGSLGALAIVGAGMPIAVGAALGFRMQGCDSVAVPFFGDGAANTGNFHESLNLAAIWDLPIVFVLENNRYAVSTSVDYATKVDDLSVRAVAYGIPGLRVDGNNVLEVYEAASEAVERARRGKGPTLLVTETYRIEGHYAGEPQVYREGSEVEQWRSRAKDPIVRFRAYCVSKLGIDEDELESIDAAVDLEMEEAVRFALESPEPDPATAMDYVYA